MKINYKRLLICISVPIILGTIVGLLTAANSSIESILPSWVFIVVWTILYFLMGISSYIIYQKEETIPTVYITNLIFNLLWCFIFFKFKWFIFALIWLIILFMIILRMIKEFKSIDKLAGNLQIPYLIWTVVAIVLNILYIIK